MAVELALIAPLLFMLVFGIIEFGIFFSRYQILQGAAREGARLAAVRAETADVRSRVIEAGSPWTSDLDPSIIAVSVQTEDGTPAGSECTDATAGGKAVVSWVHDFQDAIVLPFVPDIDFTLDLQGVFRCE